MKLLLKILRYTFFFIFLVISMLLFYIHTLLVLDNNTYYTSSNIKYSQSEEIKDLFSLSQFHNIIITGFKYKMVSGDDIERYVTFNITIPLDDYQKLLDYLSSQKDLPLDTNHPYIYIVENSLFQSEDETYKLEITCSIIEAGHEISYLMESYNPSYSKEAWVLLPLFLFILLLNVLIILPYSRIIRFLYIKKAPPK